MEVFAFHLMPWPHLPDDYDGPAWIKVPNELYDPEKGHDVYARYLDELVMCEPLGFDGIVVNEHHQNAYGLMPSPNLFASMLTQRTERVKIAVVGNALPLYNPPLRVAEEYAVLDVVSGGRLICGMVVGGGPEYYSFGLNPAECRRRFNEALDLILKAWTQPGPFEYNGEFYKLRYVNPWPRPIQQPHPPIWIPGIGSIETMEFVAEHRFSYTGIPFFHMDVFKKNYALFRKIWTDAGNEPDPESLGWLTPIYVAETDAKAREEYEEHFMYFAKRLLNGVQIAPPGYTTARSAMRMRSAMGKFMTSVNSWEEIVEGQYAVVGSPQTVADILCESIDELGCGKLLGNFHTGTLPHHLTVKNQTLFAEEVLPVIRREFPGGPVWKDAAAAA